MKRILLVVLLLIFSMSSAHAADTCAIGGLKELGNKSGKYEILLTCTADNTATFSYTLTAGEMSNFGGKYGWKIASSSNTVSDAADLEVSDTFGRVWLPVSGNGTDFLNQAASPATMEFFTGAVTNDIPVFNAAYPLTFYGENVGVAGGQINLLITLLD